MAEPTSTDREVLPIPEPSYEGPVYEDAKDPNATFPPIAPLRPPAGAPNVLIVSLTMSASLPRAHSAVRARLRSPSDWPQAA